MHDYCQGKLPRVATTTPTGRGSWMGGGGLQLTQATGTIEIELMLLPLASV